MKVTKSLVNVFERNQKDHGTKIALHNLLWQVAADQLIDLGANRIRTSYSSHKKIYNHTNEQIVGTRRKKKAA